MSAQIEIIELTTDLLIIGGGAAGCMAAITAYDNDVSCQILIMEKAQIERSGCLAAGINAINAYLNPGETPESFLAYVKKEAYGIIRDELVLSIAQELNEMAHLLESWGLPIYKGQDGQYLSRGKRSIKIKGERIKPLLAAQVKKRGITVLNRVVATNYLKAGDRVSGAVGFSVRENKFYVVSAKAVICATAGAAGIYGPNNHNWGRHKTWYPPFNTGAGLAMGIRAGAEMTSLEMRFIALRVKDTLAPTGTVAQGVRIKQINGLGENYLEKYAHLTTAGRLKAGLIEEEAGRGPCFLDTTKLTKAEGRKLKEAYLHMCPSMVLAWANQQIEPNEAQLEIVGSEPYLVGGHAMAGYWIKAGRQTSLPGLYAAGEVAGGVPKKYVTGSMAEGKIAALTALAEVRENENQQPPNKILDKLLAEIPQEFNRTFSPLFKKKGIKVGDLEEALQKVMDEYAGGIRENYKLTERKLRIAAEKLVGLSKLANYLQAKDLHQLMACHEVMDRIIVAQVLVAHLRSRKESRWPVYQERVDYPFSNAAWDVFINSTYSKERDAISIITKSIKGELVDGSAN